jgi:hypothetical protein
MKKRQKLEYVMLKKVHTLQMNEMKMDNTLNEKERVNV